MSGIILLMWFQLSWHVGYHPTIVHEHASQTGARCIYIHYLGVMTIWNSKYRSTSQPLLQFHKSWLTTIIPLKFDIFSRQPSQWCCYSREVLNKMTIATTPSPLFPRSTESSPLSFPKSSKGPCFFPKLTKEKQKKHSICEHKGLHWLSQYVETDGLGKHKHLSMQVLKHDCTIWYYKASPTSMEPNIIIIPIRIIAKPHFLDAIPL